MVPPQPPLRTGRRFFCFVWFTQASCASCFDSFKCPVACDGSEVDPSKWISPRTCGLVLVQHAAANGSRTARNAQQNKGSSFAAGHIAYDTVGVCQTVTLDPCGLPFKIKLIGVDFMDVQREHHSRQGARRLIICKLFSRNCCCFPQFSLL